MGKVLQFRQDAKFIAEAGRAALQNENYVTAITLLHKAVELKPSDPEPRVDLSLCYMAIGANDEAEAVLEEAIASQRSPDPALIVAYAHSLFATGAFHLAVDMLRQIGEDDIDSLLATDGGDDTIDIDFSDDDEDIMLADDSYSVVLQLRDMLDDGDFDGALQLAESIDKNSANYPEALKTIAMVHMAREQTDMAVDCLKQVIALRPHDAFCLATLLSIDSDLAARETYMQALQKVEIDSQEEVAWLCRAMLGSGASEQSTEIVESLYRAHPYSKPVLDALIKLYSHLGKTEKAKELALTAHRLYPDDCVFTMLNRMTEEGIELPLEAGIDRKEAERRVNALEDWLEKKSSIDAVVRGLQENSEMNEYVHWLFQTDLYGVQVNVGCFLAQSPKWQPFIRALLLKELPDALKFEFIRALLPYAADKRYRLISGDAYYEYKPIVPINLCETFADAYYTAFAALSVSQDDFIDKLDRTFAEMVKRVKRPIVPFDDSDLLAAAIVMSVRWRKPSLGKKEIAQLFNLAVSDIAVYQKQYFPTDKGGCKNA